MISRDEVRRALTGPVASIHVMFTRDGEIDYRGLKDQIDFVVENGSGSVILTWGDSLFTVLTDSEVGEVTKKVSEFTAGRAMVVASCRSWWTGKTLEFTRHARDVGADIIMLRPPDWADSATVETMVDHYAVVAREMPVMVLALAFGRSTTFALKVIERIYDSVDGVMAVKDDICGEFGRKMAAMMYDNWAVYAGGQKQNHLNLVPFGVDGFMSTFIKFKPSVAHEYWKAVQEKNMDRAGAVIRDHEMPFFDYIVGLEGGFAAGLYAALELRGIGRRWRRKPYYDLSDAELEQMRSLMTSKGRL
ncbi:MAG: dihydrodipicolinate synthase family protein [SAR202 cluster bacterium]|nr:dihydrodipicolinate synthase family protein [SAR202 cluster bacterium]